jgi:hypothetical protein
MTTTSWSWTPPQQSPIGGVSQPKPQDYIGQFYSPITGTSAYLSAGGGLYTPTGEHFGYLSGTQILGAPGTPWAGQQIGTYDPANQVYMGMQGPVQYTPLTQSPGVNYPMNPLGDVLSMPQIQAQADLLSKMASESYMQSLLKPYISETLASIGRSGLPSSSYADRMIADTIANVYLRNMLNILGGYQALTPQITGLAQVYQQPYRTALDFILSF